nr:MAG TPA: hypothetical protein [Caudoviricetes sp.]
MSIPSLKIFLAPLFLFHINNSSTLHHKTYTNI